MKIKKLAFSIIFIGIIGNSQKKFLVQVQTGILQKLKVLDQKAR